MAKIKLFRAEYGTSVEVHGIWHKLNCAVELEPEEGEDDIKVKDKAWNIVFAEIEHQLKDIR